MTTHILSEMTGNVICRTERLAKQLLSIVSLPQDQRREMFFDAEDEANGVASDIAEILRAMAPEPKQATIEPPSGEQDQERADNPLGVELKPFAWEIFGREDTHLRFAVDALNQAHETGFAIEMFTRIIRNDAANDNRFSGYVLDGLYAGINQLAKALHTDISREACRLEKILARERGESTGAA